jgi:hypothetical protein
MKHTIEDPVFASVEVKSGNNLYLTQRDPETGVESLIVVSQEGAKDLASVLAMLFLASAA